MTAELPRGLREDVDVVRIGRLSLERQRNRYPLRAPARSGTPKALDRFEPFGR